MHAWLLQTYQSLSPVLSDLVSLCWTSVSPKRTRLRCSWNRASNWCCRRAWSWVPASATSPLSSDVDRGCRKTNERALNPSSCSGFECTLWSSRCLSFPATLSNTRALVMEKQLLLQWYSSGWAQASQWPCPWCSRSRSFSWNWFYWSRFHLGTGLLTRSP